MRRSGQSPGVDRVPDRGLLTDAEDFGEDSDRIRTLIPIESERWFRGFRTPGGGVRRVALRNIREVLRLTFGEGLSRRQVIASAGVPLTTVSDYVGRAALADVGWPLPADLDAGLRLLPVPAAARLCRQRAALEGCRAAPGARHERP